MGTREESMPTREIKGWSGKIRPLQCEASKCRVCEEPVFVDPQAFPKRATHLTEYVHWACTPSGTSSEILSTVIPVGGGNT